MFKKMPNASNLLYTMLVVVLFSSCEKETELILGKKYATSSDWESKNPFEEIEIDTVKITGLKDGYIEWEYKDGYRQSSKIETFRLFLEHNH